MKKLKAFKQANDVNNNFIDIKTYACVILAKWYKLEEVRNNESDLIFFFESLKLKKKVKKTVKKKEVNAISCYTFT